MTVSSRTVAFEAAPDGSLGANGFRVNLDVGEDSLLKSWTGAQATTAHARLTNLPQTGSTLTVKAKGVYVFVYVNYILNGGCWDHTAECSTSIGLRPDQSMIPLDGGYFSASGVQQSFLMPFTTTTVDIFIARPDGTSVQPDEHLSIESTWDFGCSEECAQQGGTCHNGACACDAGGYGRHCSVESDDMCYYLVSDIDSPQGAKRQQLTPIDMDADYAGASFADFYGVAGAKAHSGMERHEAVALSLLRKGGKLAVFASLDHLNPRTGPYRALQWGFHVREYYDILDYHGELDTGRTLYRWCDRGQSINTRNRQEMNSLWRNVVDYYKDGVLDDCGDYSDATWWSGLSGGRETDGFQAVTGWPSSYTDGIIVNDIPLPQGTPLANGSYEKVVIEMTMNPDDVSTRELLKYVFLVTYSGSGGYQWIPITTSAMANARFEVQKCCAEPMKYTALVSSVSDPGFIGKYANDKDCVAEIAPESMVEPAFFYTHYNELDFGTGDGLSVYTTAAMDTEETCSILDTELLTTSTGSCNLDASVQTERLGKGHTLPFPSSGSVYQRFVSDAGTVGGGYSGAYAVSPLLDTITAELELPGAESCFVLDGTTTVHFRARNFDPSIVGVGCRWNRNDALVTKAAPAEAGWYTCSVPSKKTLPGAEAYAEIDLHLTAGVTGAVSSNFITVPLCSSVDFASSTLTTTSNKDRFLAGVDGIQMVGLLRSASGFLLSGDIEDVTSPFSGVFLAQSLRARMCCGPTAADRDCRGLAAGDLVAPSQEVLGATFDAAYSGFLFPAFDTSALTSSTLCTVYSAHKDDNVYGGWSAAFDLSVVGDVSETIPTSIVMDWNFTEAATAAGSTPAGICTEYSLSPAGAVCWPDLPAEYDAAVDVKVTYDDGTEAAAVGVALSWDCKLMDGSAIPGTFTFPAIANVVTGLRQPVPRPTILDDVLCKLQGTSNIDGNVINGVTSEGALVHVQGHVAADELLFVSAAWQNGDFDPALGGRALYGADATLRLDAVFGNGSYADQSFTELDVTFTCDNGVTIDPLVGSAPSDAGTGVYTTVVFPGDASCTATVTHGATGLSATTSAMHFVPVIESLSVAFESAAIVEVGGVVYHIDGAFAGVLVGGTLNTGGPLTSQLDSVSVFWRCKDDSGTPLTVLTGSEVVGVDGFVSMPYATISGVTDFIANEVLCAATARVTKRDGSDITVESDFARFAPSVAVAGTASYLASDLVEYMGTVFHVNGTHAELAVTGQTLWDDAVIDLSSLTGEWACSTGATPLTVSAPAATAVSTDGTLVLPYPTITDNAAGPVVAPVMCKVVVSSPVPGGTPVTYESSEARFIPGDLLTASVSLSPADLTSLDGTTYYTGPSTVSVTVSGDTAWGMPSSFKAATAVWECESEFGVPFTVSDGPVAVPASGLLALPLPTITDNAAGPIDNPQFCKVVVSSPIEGADDVTAETGLVRVVPLVLVTGTVSYASSDLVTHEGTEYHVNGTVALVSVEGKTIIDTAPDYSDLQASWSCHAGNGSVLTVSNGAAAVNGDGTVLLTYPAVTDNPDGPHVSPVFCKVVVSQAVPGGPAITLETDEVRFMPAVVTSGTASFDASELTVHGDTFHTAGSASVAVTGKVLWGADGDLSTLSACWSCVGGDGSALTVSDASVDVPATEDLVLTYPTITDNAAGPIDNPQFCKVVVTGTDASFETAEVRIAPSVAVAGTASFLASDLVEYMGTVFHVNGTHAELAVTGQTLWDDAVIDLSSLTGEWACSTGATPLTVSAPAATAVSANGTLVLPYPTITDNAAGPVVAPVMCKVVVSSPVPGGTPVTYESSEARLAPAVVTSGTASFDASELTVHGDTFHTAGSASVAVTGKVLWGADGDLSTLSASWSCVGDDGSALTVSDAPVVVPATGDLVLSYPTITDNAAGPIDNPQFCKVVVTGSDASFETAEVRIAPLVLTDFAVTVSSTSLYALQPVTWAIADGTLVHGVEVDLSAYSPTASFDCHDEVVDVTAGTLDFPAFNASVVRPCVVSVTIVDGASTVVRSATVQGIPLVTAESSVSGLSEDDGVLSHADGTSFEAVTTITYADGTVAEGLDTGADVVLQCRSNEYAPFETKESRHVGTKPFSVQYPSMEAAFECRLVTSNTLLAAVHTTPIFLLAPAAIASVSVDVEGDALTDGVPASPESDNINVTVSAVLQNGTEASNADIAATSEFSWSCCVLNATSGGCFGEDVPVELSSGRLTSFGSLTLERPPIGRLSLCVLSVSVGHSGNIAAPFGVGTDAVPMAPSRDQIGGSGGEGLASGTNLALLIAVILVAFIAYFMLNKKMHSKKITPAPSWLGNFEQGRASSFSTSMPTMATVGSTFAMPSMTVQEWSESDSCSFDWE